jgi:outer membrane protein OmpA-like peptidoglycan-associated protein
MQGQGTIIKTVGIVALANFLLCVAAAQADQATYLKQEASYCEIFQAINPNIPEECYEELGLQQDMGATRGLKTRGIRLHTPNKAVQSASHAAAPAEDGADETYAIAMHVPFLFDSDQLTDEARSILDRVGRVLNSELMDQTAILVEGHADASGSDTYNLSLSTRRALAVQAYLVEEHSISMDRLLAEGKGEAEPYDSADPYAGINRRVEFTNLGG